MFKDVYDLREGEVVYFLTIPYGIDEYRVKKHTVGKIDYSLTGKNMLKILLCYRGEFMPLWRTFTMEQLNKFVYRDEKEAYKVADNINYRNVWGS